MASVPQPVLALVLCVPALDLFFTVQPGGAFTVMTTVASAVTVAALTILWARHPRTTWLLAAALAATASLALRLAHADGAPLLSLLAVVALGVGGAFASYEPELTIEGA